MHTSISKRSVVMVEADLDASPRTLHFFVDGYQQPILFMHIPQSINFAVCIPHVLLLFTLIQVSTGRSNNTFTLSLCEVAVCSSRRMRFSKVRTWGKDWEQ
jgi:hypothetical protein